MSQIPAKYLVHLDVWIFGPAPASARIHSWHTVDSQHMSERCSKKPVQEDHPLMNDAAKQVAKDAATKVPAVTLGFWIIKILATTLGETGGDTLTMTIFHADKLENWGYLVGAAIFGGVLVALVVAQIIAKRFHPALYWATIVASTTFGTALADFADRSLGIGYTGGSLLLLFCVLATLGVWRWTQGTVSVSTVSTPKVEAFYWATITFSQTLGTALGDWLADTRGFGYERGALVFTAGLAGGGAPYLWTGGSPGPLFL